MSTKRFGRMQKAAALVPLALLSAAWTASLAGVGAAPPWSPARRVATTRCPTAAASPARRSRRPPRCPTPTTPTTTAATPARILATSSANGIPSSALAAYQRAETVINSADKACNLTWQLVAAIGRVESNHGRFGGNALDDQGVAQPGIFGKALNGKSNTSVIRDTDAGQLDSDTPTTARSARCSSSPRPGRSSASTPTTTAQRNPQDIDDAALATAVYLCSGDDDLSTVAGQRAAVYRYNHSTSYVNLVLRIMNNYLAGDFMSVPDGTTAAGYLVPEPPVGTPSNGNNGGQNQNDGSDIDAAPLGQNPSDDNGGNDNGGDNDNGGGDNGGGDNGGDNDQPAGQRPAAALHRGRPGRRRADPGPGHRPVHPRRDQRARPPRRGTRASRTTRPDPHSSLVE